MSVLLSVADLLAEPGKAREVEVTVPLDVELGGGALHGEAATRLHLRSLTDGVVVTGSAAAVADLVCTRCLTTWREPLEVTVSQVYRLRPEDPDEELAVEPGGLIEVGDVVRDELALGVPLAPVCSADCRGLCPTCGTDLNTAPCGGHDEGAGSPFAALKELLEP